MNKTSLINILNGYALLCILMCVDISVAVAETYQSHSSIYQAAKTFIRGHVASQRNQAMEITTGKLDSRLKLKKCSQPLHAFLPKGSSEIGKTTIGVKCTGVKPWSLHVPITISIYKNVLAAARTLQKGDVLTKADIKLVNQDISSLSYGYFESIKIATGMKIKRRALAGTVLTPAMLKKPQIITRGQKIAILAKSGRMEVRMIGKALSNGALGDRIKVMNMKSRQKVEGVVMSSTEVNVDI